MLVSVSGGLYTGVGAGAALGLAAGGCIYAAMWPGSQIFGRTLVAPHIPGELALTFDDGPNPVWTPRLMETLAKFNVKATFFVVGRFAAQEPLLTRHIAEAGHLVGNHSWSHANLALSTATRIREELTRTKDTLEQVTGKPLRYFRPPFGTRRPDVLSAARELGMVPVLWNAMTSDWSERSSDRIAGRLIRKIAANQRRGRASNIVLHDGGHHGLNADRAPSVAAVEQLLAHFSATHRFVTVDAWAASAGN
jgi:peptidoglycan/xylan/chitin deacetylase (PgdA/CDA1 family)